MGERNPQDLVVAREFLERAATRLNLDPAVLDATVPHLLGLTKQVAHGVVRPAAPLAAFLVGLAVAQNPAEPGEATAPQELGDGVLAKIAAVQELVEEYKNGQA